MDTQLHSVTSEFALGTAPHPAILSRPVPLLDAAPEAPVMALSNRLHRHLDIEDLIAAFDEIVNEQVDLDGMSFVQPNLGIEIIYGEYRVYSLAYRLQLFGEELGEVAFQRKRIFNLRETQRLENSLCALVHPLHNALRYHEALRSAYCDPLTGLHNRAALNEYLRHALELSERQPSPLSLIMLDIDHFKRVNDDYGHPVGDLALQSVARSIQASIRASDVAFRYGGEEFTILLSHTDLAGSVLLAERIRLAIAELPPVPGTQRGLTISLGTAQRRSEENSDQWLRRADCALYQAKTQGRNQVVAADDGLNDALVWQQPHPCPAPADAGDEARVAPSERADHSLAVE